MDSRKRALLFTRYVGMELKGKITTRGFTAKEIAERTKHSASALNRWLNGHVELPLTVLCESCEVIGVEPGRLIDAAYDRLVIEYGEPDSGAEATAGNPADTGLIQIAAKKGPRKTDVDHAE